MLIHIQGLIPPKAHKAMHAILGSSTTPWENFRLATDSREMRLELPENVTHLLRIKLCDFLTEEALNTLSVAVDMCGGKFSKQQILTSLYFHKYMEGSDLGPHYDVRSADHPDYGKTFASIIYYFNDDYFGGDFVVNYPSQIDMSDVIVCGGDVSYRTWISRSKPEPGDAIVISNGVFHSVDMIASGNKYIGVMHCA